MNERNFTIVKPLGQVGHRADFLGKMTDNGQLVVVHRYLGATPSQVPEWEHISYEAKNIAELSAPGLQKFPFCSDDTSGITLVSEHITLPTLEQFLQKSPQGVGLATFFAIAKSLLQALAYAHQHKVLHKSLYPANIFLRPEDYTCTIGAFSIFELLNRRLTGEDHSAEALKYIAPELTKKMNRMVEAPADIYALGCIFYHLLSGSPPFKFARANQIIYAHLAIVPKPLSELKPEIPAELSEMLGKMLSKEPFDRYRSAAGVLADVQAIENRYLHGKTDLPIVLGAADRKLTFSIPDKLYGREAEVKSAIAHFESMGRERMNVLCISGYSGVGKTRLVQELQKPLTARAGNFVAGKYEQYHRSIPYSALAQALTLFCNQILSRENDYVEAFKRSFNNLTKGEGRAVTELIPNLSLLVGEQPQLPEVSLEVNELRVQLNLEALLTVMTEDEDRAPLILFIDDIQWADRASINFLTFLLKRHRVPNLHLVFAYRSNEMHENNAFFLLREDLAADPFISWLNIEIQPLAQEAVTELIAETLTTTFQRVQGLTQTVYQKTQGNPFFVRQMMEALYSSGAFVQSAEGWHWDGERIAGMEFADDVVSFMIWKLSHYAQDSQDMANMAAVIGARFTVDQLHKLSGLPAQAVYNKLHPLIADNLLEDSNGLIRFAHDRVQEACYKIYNEAELRKRHFRIARMLDEELPEQERSEKIFDIVEHYNHASQLLATSQERNYLAHLNLQAGQRALASSAYSAAFILLNTAVRLHEETREDLADKQIKSPYSPYELYSSYAQAAHCDTRYELAESSIKKCIALEPDALTNEKMIALYIDLMFIQNRHAESIAFGAETLRNLGFPIATDASKVVVFKHYLQFLLVGGWRNPRRWEKHRACSDKKAAAALKVMNHLLPAAYMVNSNLIALLAMDMSIISIRYGFTKETAGALIAVGAFELAILKLIKRGRSLFEVSRKILKRFPDARVNAQVHFVYNIFGNQWWSPLAQLIPEYKQAATLNLEIGVLHWADYSYAFSTCHWLFAQQLNLDDLEHQARELLNFYTSHRDQEVIAQQHYVIDLLRDMAGKTGQHLIDHRAYARAMAQPGNLMPRANFDIFNQFLLNYRGNFTASAQSGLSYIIRSLDLFGILLEFFHRFSFALAWLNKDRRAFTVVQRIVGNLYYYFNITCLWIWKNNCPQNYEAPFRLVRAEQYGLQRRYAKARKSYWAALAASHSNNWLMQGLIWQRFAAFELHQGHHDTAEVYCREAFRIFRSWGFHAQCDYLLSTYDTFALIDRYGKAGPSEHLPAKNTVKNGFHELDDINKTALAIANKTTTRELIDLVLKVVMQSTAAHRAVLFQPNPAQSPMIIAEAALGNKTIACTLFPPPGLPLSSVEVKVCQSLVTYVMRKQDFYIIDDSHKDMQFNADPYLKSRSAQSLLCYPIMSPAGLSYILYLENHISTGMFSPTQISVLNLLMAQFLESMLRLRAYEQLQEVMRQRSEQTERLQRFTQEVTDKVDLAARMPVEGSDEIGQLALRVNKLLAKIQEATVSRNMVEQMINAIGDLLFLINERGDIILVNKATIDNLGYSASELVNAPINVLLVSEHGKDWEEKLQAFLQGAVNEIQEINCNGITRNKESIPLLVSARRYRQKDGAIGGAIYAKDLRESRMSASIKERLERELAQMQGSLIAQSRLAALGDMAGGIAHEFNTPLATVIMAADQTNRIIEEDPVDKEALRKAISRIQESGGKIGKIVEELRYFSRSGEDDAFVSYSVREVINDTILLCQKNIESAGVDLRVSPFAATIAIECRPVQIRQVLMNLLQNSFYEVRKLPSQRRWIRVEAYDFGSKIQLWVEDGGNGFDPRIRDKVMQPFITTKEPGEGVGLGLSVAAEIAKNHGGRIFIDETAPHTRVVVELPKEQKSG